jgi:hypothetical protein
VSNQIGFPDGAVTLDLGVAWIHGSEAAKYVLPQMIITPVG